MRPIFYGSGVALITPFEKDGKIDFDVFSRLIEFQISNKTDAIIVCGTTGEGSTLTVEERLRLFSLAVEKVNGRVPVIAGTGSNSTSFSLELIKEAEKCGIDAHLSVTPYYNKTSQSGIIKHFYKLADNSTKPILVYNVPSRTGVNITPETYKELGKHDNIVGVKEADVSITKLQKSIYLCEDTLDFYIGNDDMIVPAILSGCKGVISVLSNILPSYTHKLTSEALSGNINESNLMQHRVISIIEALFSDVNPIPVKAAMEYLYNVNSGCRLPLCAMSSNYYNRLIDILEENKCLFDSEALKFV
ncbi:MAG: 4-hydroxy-tetrahydrodipicolinate synthase [Clostridia bacterium]|nr:4-hydroxy-tetrahydrodipicolinate synthase [Clostridia bacterium]